MTRVALVNLTTTTKIGGVETFVRELARHLAECGIEITIIGGTARSAVMRDAATGVQVATAPYLDRALLRRIPLLGRRYGLTKLLERLSFALRARAIIEQGDFALVHIHKPFDFPLAWWIGRRTGARIVYSSHGRDFFPGDRWFTRAIHQMTACSAYNAAEVYEQYGREARVIYNGIDTEQFAPRPPDTVWRAQTTGDRAPLILWVGRLERWKGTIDALRALALLDCAAHLVIVGVGPELPRLRHAAQSLGIAARVHFLGARDHAALPAIYASADLVIGTSFANETFGMALAEASACAQPVVATRFGGFPEVVIDGETGLLVPPRDPRALATAIAILLADPVRCRAMGDAGRVHVVTHFAWPVVTERVLAVYREALVRIDFVTTFGVVRGFPSFPEATLARQFVADGHQVRALTYFAKSSPMIDTHHDVIDGTIVHRIRRKGFFTPGIVGWIARDAPDIAHLHHLSNRLSALALPAYHARGIPVVFSPYGILHDPVLVDDTDRPLATTMHKDRIHASLVRTAKASGVRRGTSIWLLHHPLFAADAVHAMSLHEKRILVALGVPEARVHFIPVGIDETLLASDAPIARAAAPTVLFLGQTKYRKGWDILVRAIPAILRAMPETRFIFAGHTGRDRADFDVLVQELGVAEVITAPGRVSEEEKIRLLRSSWVLTLPARYEGFGIPLVEAMMVGTPVVTTNVPACNEIVRDGETGLVVEPDDPAALTAGLLRLLGDAALRTRLARASAHDAAQRYEARVVARQYEALYSTLIARRH